MIRLFLLFWLTTVVNTTFSQERILDFQSTVTVNDDRTVDVTEVITVQAEGINIQRGIFRDIITTMQNEQGKKQNLELNVYRVLKNDQPENFVTESNGIYTRIKIGDANVLLGNGVYTYTITYKLNRQVRFFETYDEVYWNATGNGWQFAIEKAGVTIYLPQDVVISQHAGYSGPEGSSGCSCTASEIAANAIRYEITSPLNPYEGLTIAVGWQKGVILPPTAEEEKAESSNDYFDTYTEFADEALKENNGLTYGVAGLLVLFTYLIFAWFKVGRDPMRGAIIPRFVPPDGFSPAACRYVLRMTYDAKAFTACIVSMAVKGFLVIDQSKEDYQLKKISDDVSKLTAGEKKVAENIFHGTSSVTLDSTYDSWLNKGVSELGKQLKFDFRKINFNKNYGWMVPAIFLGLGAVGIMLWEVRMFFQIIIVPIIVVGFFTIFIVVPLASSIANFRRTKGCARYGGLIFSLGLTTAGIGVPLFLQNQFNLFNMSWVGLLIPFLLVIIGVIFLIALFFYLIKAPTVFGRQRMDEIEGLKMFMEVAEKDRLNMLNPPDKTPQLFEQLLPYAIALDVENAWGKQFDTIIAQAIERKEYTPTWYVGRSMFNANTITSNLGSSLSSSLQSSSTPPSSSSSGSGGGGSSGGGGGGGGGGGW